MTAPATLDRVTWPRRTQRLAIRPASAADLRAIFEIRALPTVGHWMPERPETYEGFVLRMGRHDALKRTLVIELDGLVIGDLYLHVTDPWAQAEVVDRVAGQQAEIGWVLDPAQQGHGYATEAVRELVRLCFEDLGVRRLVASAFNDNAPSLAVMERLGMRRETHGIADSFHRDLGWVDSATFALLVDEWRQHQPAGRSPDG
jgi:RimJ/RimL family protein N-acetyltransferase